jgi:hypothetical protein
LAAFTRGVTANDRLEQGSARIVLEALLISTRIDMRRTNVRFWNFRLEQPSDLPIFADFLEEMESWPEAADAVRLLVLWKRWPAHEKKLPSGDACWYWKPMYDTSQRRKECMPLGTFNTGGLGRVGLRYHHSVRAAILDFIAAWIDLCPEEREELTHVMHSASCG